MRVVKASVVKDGVVKYRIEKARMIYLESVYRNTSREDLEDQSLGATEFREILGIAEMLERMDNHKNKKEVNE
ncbi:MAG: hypothetical protein ACNYVW_00490 [Methanosarcinales archaeon]